VMQPSVDTATPIIPVAKRRFWALHFGGGF
jgi:hypothetical protein